jgi:excisionase family DNA binding protein
MESPSAAAKPFTPESLAERWSCSAEMVRQMIHRGELPAFRLGGGKLFRIQATEVERYECAHTQQTNDTNSSSIERSSQLRSVEASIAADTRRVLTTLGSHG